MAWATVSAQELAWATAWAPTATRRSRRAGAGTPWRTCGSEAVAVGLQPPARGASFRSSGEAADVVPQGREPSRPCPRLQVCKGLSRLQRSFSVAAELPCSEGSPVHAPASLLELLEPRQLAHEPVEHTHDTRVALPRADELLLDQVELQRLLDPGEHLVRAVRVRVRVEVEVGVGVGVGVRVRVRARVRVRVRDTVGLGFEFDPSEHHRGDGAHEPLDETSLS
eukprot:scaffold82702_cov59-Phaeocystis_antarctica.AAC.5